MSRPRRTVDRSVSQIRDDIDEFDQSRPDFEEAETAASFLAGARPAGCVDLERDAEIVPAGRDHEGAALHLKAQGSHMARVLRGELHSLSVRREPAEGGERFVLRFDGAVVMTSSVYACEDADAMEAPFRDALTAFAAAHPLARRDAAANDGGPLAARRTG